jgi:hypothetical protein
MPATIPGTGALPQTVADLPYTNMHRIRKIRLEDPDQVPLDYRIRIRGLY